MLASLNPGIKLSLFKVSIGTQKINWQVYVAYRTVPFKLLSIMHYLIMLYGLFSHSSSTYDYVAFLFKYSPSWLLQTETKHNVFTLHLDL